MPAKIPSSPTDAPEIFRSSKTMLILLLALSALCFFLAGLLAWFPGDADTMTVFVGVLALAAAGALLGGYGFLSWKKERVELWSDRIAYQTTFGRRELSVERIKGFQILVVKSTRYLLLLPNDPKAKRIKISLSMKNASRLEEWARANTRDLDAEKYQRDLEEILANDEFGFTVEDRQAFLDRGTKVAKVINFASAGVMLWAFVMPTPYAWVMWCALLLPVPALAAGALFRGLVRLNGARSKAYPNVGIGIIGSALVLAGRGALDWNILSWNPIWTPVAVGTFLLLGLCLLAFREARSNPVDTALLFLFCMVFGFGSALTINGLLDHSTPKTYDARIVDKHYSGGRHPTYDLKLSAWGPRTTTKDVEVDEDLYEAVSVGEPVVVCVMQGSLGIPWYAVVKPGE